VWIHESYVHIKQAKTGERKRKERYGKRTDKWKTRIALKSFFETEFSTSRNTATSSPLCSAPSEQSVKNKVLLRGVTWPGLDSAPVEQSRVLKKKFAPRSKFALLCSAESRSYSALPATLEGRSPSVTRRLESDLCQFVELDELILVAYSIFPDRALN